MLFLLVFWIRPAAAQLPDSLAATLPALPTTRILVDTLNERAWVQRHNRPGAALLFAREARRLADSTGYEEGQAWAWRNEGVIAYIRGNYDEAITADIRGLRIFQRLGNEEGIASAYNNIGVVHWELGHFEKAQKYFADVLDLDASTRQRATATSNLGLIKSELGKYDEALRLTRSALDMHMEDGDLLAASTALNNIGWIYELEEDYDQALREYQRCLELRERLGDRRRIASVSLSLGTVLRHKQRYEESLAHTGRALGIAKEIGEKKIQRRGTRNSPAPSRRWGATRTPTASTCALPRCGRSCSTRTRRASWRRSKPAISSSRPRRRWSFSAAPTHSTPPSPT